MLVRPWIFCNTVVAEGYQANCWYYIVYATKLHEHADMQKVGSRKRFRTFWTPRRYQRHLPESPGNSCSLDSLCCSRFWCNDPAISTRNATMPLGPTQTCLLCPWISGKWWKTFQQRILATSSTLSWRTLTHQRLRLKMIKRFRLDLETWSFHL